jgi:hypothetical protein
LKLSKGRNYSSDKSRKGKHNPLNLTWHLNLLSEDVINWSPMVQWPRR